VTTPPEDVVNETEGGRYDGDDDGRVVDVVYYPDELVPLS
jgi:hypothetical protein